ncbi:hypothetical protein [Rhodococcus pyridinivorans]|uniref:Uncharacterized protein n=1 Tax=Rhodococcus pyridinivorans TaxID=103816 RepID=A0A7M2XHC7_9NOCA|nr:hypothetical protein [Rhodococcus pyridinivorans]QOV97184.1 hypothetical protein INP59_14500 [Rhodococcus pyridinivorans]
MARSHGRIDFTIWNNREFRALSERAQRTYMMLFGQKDVNNAGVLPLMESRWAKYSESTTVEDVRDGLRQLEDARFVFVDDDTEELLIRSFIRGDGVIKQPNVFKNALKCAELVDSPKLRKVLAGELRGLRRRDAGEVADRLDPNPSETLPDAVANPSETLHEPLNPSGRVREPRGVGVGEEESSCSADGDLGGRGRAHAYTREASEPTPHCSQHPGGTDAPCRACGDARKARAEWEAGQALAAARARSEAARVAAQDRRAAIDACSVCDGDGYIGTDLCTHAQASAARPSLKALFDQAQAEKKPQRTGVVSLSTTGNTRL